MGIPILGANSASGFDISNSLRFNDGDQPVLSRNPSSTGNRRTFTISAWVKRCKTDNVDESIFNSNVDSGNNRFTFGISNAGNILIYNRTGGTTYSLASNDVLSDPSAWYHCVCIIDSTDSTEADRMRMYVNGTRITSFADNVPISSQNVETAVNRDDTTHAIGDKQWETSHFDGYISEHYFLDGVAYEPTYFAETNENGVWVPKQYTGGNFGTNGHFLQFKQTGTSANSSGIGADTSGNDNHYTPTNLAAIDVTSDTPTNNFCTLSSVDNNGFVLTEGNLDFDSSSGSDEGVRGTMGVLAGKWYYECKITGGSGVGLSAGNVGYSQSTMKLNNNPRGGQCIVMNGSSSINFYNFSSSAVVLDASSGVGQNDIVGVALDLDSGTKTIQFYKNGSTIGSAQTIASGLLQGDFFIPSMFDDGGVNDVIGSFNFGQPTFSISSGNADDNGYGNFEYAPPSGYYALCTKNLGEHG